MIRYRLTMTAALTALTVSGCGDPAVRARASLLLDTRSFFKAIDKANAPCYRARDAVGEAQRAKDYAEMRRAAAKAEPICREAVGRMEAIIPPADAEPMQAAYFRQARSTCAASLEFTAQQLAVAAEPPNVRANNLLANSLGRDGDDYGRRCEADLRATLEFIGLKKQNAD